MTPQIPAKVTLQMRAAILSAFEHDDLWREINMRMGDLHNQVTHTSVSAEATELLDWVAKRGLTLELLQHLNDAIPGNTALMEAKDAFIAAEKDSPPQEPLGAGAESGFPDPAAAAVPQFAAAATTGPAKTGFQMRPWMWMVAGAFAFVVAILVLFPDNELRDLRDQCADEDYAACDALYDKSEPDSDENAFGATCGGWTVDGQLFAPDRCVDYVSLLDVSYGACQAGNLAECDALFEFSPDNSTWLDLAVTCGDIQVEGVFVEAPGQCEASFGSTSG